MHRLIATLTILTATAAISAGCGSSSSTAVEATTTTATPAASITSGGPPPTTPGVDPYSDSPLIDHVEWTNDVDGPRLRVYPTQAGRVDKFPTAGDRAWAEVVADSPRADSPGMHDQFTCHWNWARLLEPNKPSWNLEPWRPAVGYEATVSAECNPGGPER